MKKKFSKFISQKLGLLESELKDAWVSPKGTHTRFFIVDELLPLQDVENIYKEFKVDEAFWIPRSSFREKKYTFANIDKLHPIIGAITDSFHEESVLRAVSNITGIDNLESDPSLYAGGLSKMVKGDFLNPHIDNSHDGSRRRYRRLNLLFYVSPSWSLENGGSFELWNRDVTEPVALASKCNRLIVMETGDQTYHSVNEVKSEFPRCCVSNYFFSKSSPKKDDYYHVTSFTGRPNQLFQRWYGSFDNYLRNSIAKITGVSRGKSQARRKFR